MVSPCLALLGLAVILHPMLAQPPSASQRAETPPLPQYRPLVEQLFQLAQVLLLKHSLVLVPKQTPEPQAVEVVEGNGQVVVEPAPPHGQVLVHWDWASLTHLPSHLLLQQYASKPQTQDWQAELVQPEVV